MSGPRVGVVIVTYRSAGTIRGALASLRASREAGEVRCIVVDNASDDGTADLVAESFPDVTLVRSPSNLGFGRGCNLGFEHVTEEYVLMMNPDALVDRAALAALVEFADRNPRAGIVAPVTIDAAGDCQRVGLMLTAAGLIRGSTGVGPLFPDERSAEPGCEPFRTSWVCGAIMLIRTGLFRALGGFDPRFFLYFEETDLCRRASALGVEIWVVGAAVARHAGGVSARSTSDDLVGGCIARHYYASRNYYLRKHFGAAAAWTAVVASAVGRSWRTGLAPRVRRLVGRSTGRDHPSDAVRELHEGRG